MDHTLPKNYVFLLRCYDREGCPHPLCERNVHKREGIVNESHDIHKPIFCICRQPEGKEFMIFCDQCGEWYHVACIGIAEDEGTRLIDNDVQAVPTGS